MSLQQRERRLAFKLMTPAFIVLLVVALYPLGHVFYTSMTDRVFAGMDDPEFVGFENYRRLLSVSVEELPPVIDEETGEQKIDEETGEPVYERSIRVLPREPDLHRELTTFSLFGNKYVLGAISPNFIKAIWNTLYFTVVSVFLETVLGLIIALVVNSNFKGRGVIRATMLVPWAVITVVSARMWEWMFHSSRMGFFNTLLDYLNLVDEPISFLTIPQLQIPSLIAVDVWKTTPFMALLILAGLQMIPRELYEAAHVDGAGKIKQFFTITLPLIKPSLAVALVFRTLDALRVFDVFHVMLARSRYSMATMNYYELVGNRNMGLSSAIGVIIFFIIFAFAIAYMKMLGVDE
ncbi:trehalose/maltose transport system permease protein [Halarsenatibacter silvermanii]|uniref:Trehalose/maltose transport system permease protein n=2 Tax=Halarsenatibacter silvermanii TaxID=321763 RepID=A0A1G9LJP4_9FIRM|nr:sugar ABC transporter permease [Halarsenatibacter silvermanii]SDL62162.1 trehalose/maltose transport system permease protein [Halarsenatibacter silvermanii]